MVNHGRVSETSGGLAELRRLADTAHRHGLGIILDLVPNHMSVPTPAWHNRARCSVLAEGPTADSAHWFDVDWSAGDGALLMRLLKERIGKALSQGLFKLDSMTDDESAAIGDLTPSGKVLRYKAHVFPVRSGSEHLARAELLQQQHYRLAWWRVGDDELNYRRFFDIDTLAAIRVEDERVFNDNIERSPQSLETTHHDTLAVLAWPLSGEDADATSKTGHRDQRELMTRFQQVQGAVMAEGVEDTTFYRWTHLTALNEVGGAPVRFAIEPEELHTWAFEQLQAGGTGMTCLSTHDIKRSEDVRARMAVLSELADEWAALIQQVRQLANVQSMPHVNGRMENLLWQTLAATWSLTGPMFRLRLSSYLTKAMRESEEHTSWLTPNAGYESAMLDWRLALPMCTRAVKWYIRRWLIRTIEGLLIPALCKLGYVDWTARQ